MKKYFLITLSLLAVMGILVTALLWDGGSSVPSAELPPVSKEIPQEKTITQETPVQLPKEEIPAPTKDTANEVVKDTKVPDITEDNVTTCSLSVRCDTVLLNMDKLKKGKESIIPADGIIFSNPKAEFYQDETVFNLLARELKKNKIHIEYEFTPAFNSAYIEGIGNLYEFDCGDLSGWLYKVNGESPGCGCSQYKLKDGDVVEFVYSCNLGKDV